MQRKVVPLSSLIRTPSGGGSSRNPNLKIIKVSTKAIGENAQKTAQGLTRGFDPAIIVGLDNGKNGMKYAYAYCVEIFDREGNVIARVLQDDARPEISGARVWIETEGEIRCITDEDYHRETV